MHTCIVLSEPSLLSYIKYLVVGKWDKHQNLKIWPMLSQKTRDIVLSLYKPEENRNISREL